MNGPEHRNGSDGVGRHQSGPTWNWDADAPRPGDERQNKADKQEMTGLDAHAEKQQRRRNMSNGQPGLTQPTGKSQAVHEPEAERHDPRRARGEAFDSAPLPNNLTEEFLAKARREKDEHVADAHKLDDV